MTIYEVRKLSTAAIVNYFTEDDIWRLYEKRVESETYWPVKLSKESIIRQITQTPLVQMMLGYTFVEADPIKAITFIKQRYDRSRTEVARLKDQLWESRFDVYEMEDDEYCAIADVEEWDDERGMRMVVRRECWEFSNVGSRRLDRKEFATGGNEHGERQFYKRYIESERNERPA